jgi:hypothetical protein
MGKITLITFFCLAVACSNSSLTAEFNNYKFDKGVIDKLPFYDSLVNVLLENFASIRPHIKDQSQYGYMPAEDGNELYKVLPKPAADEVKLYLTQLGTNNIYGFDVFKDSTIRIHIRQIYSQADHLFIREKLSFYPTGTKIRQREFPIKDTILNQHWQYWIVFDEQEFF